MVITEEYKTLIEKMVASNKRFQGNEDLFEDFCNEAFQKAYLILSTSDNIQKTENHCAKMLF